MITTTLPVPTARVPPRAAVATRVAAERRVRAQFLEIVAANFPERAGEVRREAVASGQRSRVPPRRTPRVTTAVSPGPPAGAGRSIVPGRSGRSGRARSRPHQRSPPRRPDLHPHAVP